VIHGSGRQFTPPGLVRGRTYYFQMRALNTSTSSPASTTTQLTPSSAQQAVKVLSYNILEATDDGRHEGGSRVARWSSRKVAAARLIRAADPDVIGIQEGAAWVKRPRGPRQVDSLRKALGGEYALAHTEISPNRPHYFRTGCYVLYKKSAYRAVGHGNHWALGNNRFAAFQVLQNRQSGARFLFVSPHLAIGSGRSWDVKRRAETKRLIADAGRRTSHSHLPVVYAGDFNSDHSRHHAFDGPAIEMRSAHMADAFSVAQSRKRGSYNSANGYDRRPPRYGDHIDHVYAAPGVAVRSWRLVMRMARGRFVGVIPSDHNPMLVSLEFPY
jgi:endonuclease/exonuclease/phosphatase family metal-dependent hydrolase